MKKLVRTALPLLLFVAFAFQAKAQIDPTLSIQGILKKSNGVAVEDGAYSITFKLYTQDAGGTPIWTETQASVDVSSGIYSATLGVNTPLNVPFNQLYYLGVTVGSTELTPRILLTSAPYALSLIGQSNKFPSAGLVKADSIIVGGGVLARGGAPGLNGVSKNGYAFTGNSGDKDSGIFSTANGKVALYADNAEVLVVTPTSVQSNQNLTVTGTATANAVAINNNGSIAYNGNTDWRLVEINDFSSGADGWEYSLDDAGDRGAWKNAPAGACPVVDYGTFAGKVLQPANNDYVIKKEFSPPGTYNYVRVVFRYYALGNWDPADIASRGFAAFANNATGSNVRVGWTNRMYAMDQSWLYDYQAWRDASTFNNFNVNAGDNWVDGSMTAETSSPFWIFFGYTNNEGSDAENFAVSSIEVWVR